MTNRNAPARAARPGTRREAAHNCVAEAETLLVPRLRLLRPKLEPRHAAGDDLGHFLLSVGGDG